MGGQITRAIYRNQRRTPIKDNPSHGRQVKELAVTFTQVMTIVLTFIVGYLYRPYLHYNSTIQNEITSIIIISIINIVAWQISVIKAIIQKYKSRNINKQKYNQKFNQEFIKYWNFVLLIAIILLLFMDIIQAISNSQIIFMMSLVYKIILLASFNTTIYCISQIFSFQKIRNPAFQSSIKGVQRTMINFNQNVYVNRTMFLFIMLQVFKKGIEISTTVNQIKNEPKIKHVEGTELYFETFSIRLVFCWLLFMISVVCVALQKKTLVYMRLNYELLVKRGQNKQKSLLHYAFSSFMFICLMFLLVNGNVQKLKLDSNQNKIQTFTSIALIVVTLAICITLIKIAKKIVKYKNQSQQAFLINFLILIFSIIHFYIVQISSQLSQIIKMSITILLIYRFVNVWDKYHNSVHQISLNLVIFFSIILITLSSVFSKQILQWCELYFQLTQSNKQANSLLIVLSSFLMIYSLLHVLLDITNNQNKKNDSNFSMKQDEQERVNMFKEKSQTFSK